MNDHARGERALMCAVLMDAIQCLGAENRGSGRHREEARQAREWVETRDREWPFSFERICEALDLDAHALRRRIRTDASATSAPDAHRPGKRQPEKPGEAAIVEMIRARELPHRIAATFGISIQMVSRLTCKHASEVQWERDAEVCRLRSDGWTVRALVDRFGVSCRRIAHICGVGSSCSPGVEPGQVPARVNGESPPSEVRVVLTRRSDEVERAYVDPQPAALSK
jgi:hypothetical protein